MTAADNKPASVARRHPVLDLLRERYAVFRDCVPLAVGIHKVIRERDPEIEAGKLRLALRSHTVSTTYLKTLLTTDQRFDLDGNVAGEVTAEQREVASNELKERFKKNAERHRAVEKAKKDQAKAEEDAKQREAKLKQLAAKFNTR